MEERHHVEAHVLCAETPRGGDAGGPHDQGVERVGDDLLFAAGA